MENFSWSVLIGGFAFFFFGLKSARRGLERVAGDRFKMIMRNMAGNRFVALILGAVITLGLQSSGATSAMLVSFADTGILSLFQASAVMFGADIGTTFVVILLSIKSITDLALIIVALGFFMEILGRSRRVRDYGKIVIGFGMVFYGMQLMTDSAIPLKNSEMAMSAFAFLAGHPLATIFVATIISAAIHSAATIGIAIALAFAGTITFEAAVPIVLGANVGTCVTALLAGLGSNAQGRRVAYAHTISKIIGVAVAFPFIPKIVQAITWFDAYIDYYFEGYEPGVATKIATLHILFNVALAVVFLPLLTPLVKFVEYMVPLPANREEEFKPKYLDRSAIETPALAFAQVRLELLRISAIAQSMFADALKMFSKGEDFRDSIENIQEEDDKIDMLEKAIRFYLAELSIEGFNKQESQIQMGLLTIAADFEDIGDTMSREMVILARKKAKGVRVFSDEGWDDLRKFQKLVLDNFNLLVSHLAQPHEELFLRITRNEENLNEVEENLHQAHIARLHKGLKESFDTSSIHLDILGDMRRVNSKIAKIAKNIMKACK